MAEFKDILKQELSNRKGVSGAVSGLASAAGKSLKEKADIRNILFGGKGLTSILGRTVFGRGYSALKDKSSKISRIGESSSVVNQESLNLLQIIAGNTGIQTKNSMALRGMSRDMNVMRQNVTKLVKLQGGTATNKADAFFMKQGEREKATEVERQKSSTGKIRAIGDKENNNQGSNSIIGMLLVALGLGGLIGGVKKMTLGLFKRIPIIGSIIMLIEDFFDSKDLAENLGIGKIPALLGQILGGSKGGIMNMFTNAGKWALLGAGLGSVVPGIGTILGGVIGAILGGVMGYFGGDEIASNIDEVFTKVSRMVEDAWDGLKDFGTYLSDAIKNVVNLISASGKEALAGVLDSIPFGLGKDNAKSLKESASADRGKVDSRNQTRAEGIQQRETTKAETRATETSVKTATKAQYDVSSGKIKGVGETGTAKEAIDFFISKGWTPEQSAGIVGNLQAESGPNMKTDAIGDGGKAYGIAQWHPDRQAIFQKTYGKPIQEAGFKEQLEFVNWELNHNEKKAGNLLKSATSPGEAAAIVDKYYERSAEGMKGNSQQRIANASSLMKEGGRVSAEGTAMAGEPTKGATVPQQVAAVPPTPTKGAVVSSASASVADLKQAVFGGGNSTVNQTTNNVAGGQAASQVASAPPNFYDNDLVKTMFEGYSLT